jgi:hypothetical protein
MYVCWFMHVYSHIQIYAYINTYIHAYEPIYTYANYKQCGVPYEVYVHDVDALTHCMLWSGSLSIHLRCCIHFSLPAVIGACVEHMCRCVKTGFCVCSCIQLTICICSRRGHLLPDQMGVFVCIVYSRCGECACWCGSRQVHRCV